jgi:hypothetical protein
MADERTFPIILVHYFPASLAHASPEARARARRTRSFTDAAAADAFVLQLWASGVGRFDARE